MLSKGTSIPNTTIGIDVYGRSVYMPLIGAGTWQYNDTIAYQSVCQAFEAGYTMVDTAFGYGNERGVGMAIQDCWRRSRNELFVMTKIPGGLSTDQVQAAHEQNLMLLGLEYVDHLMTHFPSDWKASNASPQARQEEWLALENIYYSGQARSIGISHYCSLHIYDVLEVATVVPSINQVEYHVGSQDVNDVIETCQKEGITFMSFSPLCGPCTNVQPEDSLISGKLVTEIGAKYGKTGSQVSLRFIVQQALLGKYFMGGVIPKSNNMQHIESNLDIFNFELSEIDMARLHATTKPSAEPGDCSIP
jgi:diketogulonate reductase-like aldo/keto reductase